MKRIALFFAIAAAAISCVSEEKITPEIEVITADADLVITPQEGMIPVSFNVNVDWKAEIKESEAREWCAISPAKGGKAGDNVLNVICIENKGTDNRTATVVIKAMDVVKELVITQLQKDVLVLTADKEYDIPYQGEELTFKVSHNLDLKVRSDVDWITEVSTKALTEDTFVFAVAPNTGEAREGKITFTADPFEEEIVVRQAPWVLEFEVDPAEDKAFGQDGGEYKVKVASNVDYYVNMDDNNWLTMTASGDEYTFKAEPNNDMKAREVNVRIAPKSAKYVEHAKVIKMSQKGAGAVLEISELDKAITCHSQTFQLTVDANVGYEMLYVKSVDGAYVEVPAAEKWLSHTVSGNVYTFTAGQNDDWNERSMILYFIPEEDAYADMATAVVIRQYGHAFKMWSRAITSYEGYDPSQKVRLSVYGDKLLIANTTKVYMVDPATGEVESSISMPEGVSAQNVLVDNAGNLLIAADGAVDTELVLYHVPDPMNPAPEVLLTYHTGNYYGLETGNFRVSGNIKDDAVITAVISDGQDGENLEDGAVLIWEVVDGVCGEWSWTNAPYTAWNVASLCCYPAGASLADGLFYIGYGGDYNLKYAASPVKNPVKAEVAEGETPYYQTSTTWGTSYVTGSSWQENYNCMHTAQWKGGRYAAILMGCHFDYDDPDMLLLDITDPASATHVYTYSQPLDGRDPATWGNLYWTGGGAYSDILLIPTDDALLMVAADGNYGTVTCVVIM